jgi:hypothetical protein
MVWECELSNDVAPVSALVSDSGKYVVTFDDWHRVGRGENVVVIYGPRGRRIGRHSLETLLSPGQRRRLAMSVSSTWWGHGHYLDEKNAQVVLRVATGDYLTSGKAPPKFEEMRLNLSDGKAVKPSEGK